MAVFMKPTWKIKPTHAASIVRDIEWLFQVVGALVMSVWRKASRPHVLVLRILINAEAVVGDKGVTDLRNMVGYNFRLGEIE